MAGTALLNLIACKTGPGGSGQVWLDLLKDPLQAYGHQ